MRTRLGTKPMVEGALLAAIAVVLIMLGMYVPLVGAIVVFLWPVPVVLIYLRHGPKTAVMTVVVAGMALTALFGPIQAVLIVLSFGLLGFAFGFGISRRLSSTVTLMLGSISVVGSLLVTIALSSFVMNINIINVFMTSLETSLLMARDLYGSMGMGAEAERVVDEMLESLPLFRALLPGAVALSAMMNATINYQVARSVLKRLGHTIPELPPFADWRLPSATVAIMAGVLVSLFAIQYYIVPDTVENMVTNMYFLLTMAFSVHGLALGYWLMTRWQLARWFKVLACIFVIFSPLLLPVVQWAGILDVVIDFRRLVKDRARK